MADIISIDKDKLTYCAEQAKELRTAADEVRERLKKADTQLTIHMEVMRKGVSMQAEDGMACVAGVQFSLEDIRKQIRKQSESMQHIASMTERAQMRAESVSRKLEQASERLKFILNSMVVVADKVGAAVIGWIFGVGNDSGNHTDTNKENDGDSPEPDMGNTKPYQGSKQKDWEKKDYTNFNVLKNVKDEYCYCQHEDGVTNQENACTATADRIAEAIKNDKVVEPKDNNGNWNKDYTKYSWKYTNIIDNTNGASETVQHPIIYDQIIKQGNPVIMWMKTEKVLENGIRDKEDVHVVVAVGIKNGAIRESVSLEDILVIDPGDGKIKQANQIWTKCDEYSGKNFVRDMEGSLRIPN